MEEEIIEKAVDELRSKLLAKLSVDVADAKNLKSYDTHGLAAAKKVELNKMARAFGTRAGYVEGDAFDREKQEEHKRKRLVCYITCSVSFTLSSFNFRWKELRGNRRMRRSGKS
jgi:serine/arginine repetitive matrix protein 2